MVECVSPLNPALPRHLHQQPRGRMSPAGWHHGPHLPGHGPVLAGLRQQRGGLRGAHRPAPNHQPPHAGNQHARHPPVVPPRAPLRADAELVSSPPGFHILVSQEASKVIWYSLLFRNFPQFIVIHTFKGFSILSEAQVNVILEFSCCFL